MQWRRFSLTFEAPTAQTTITFRDLTGYFTNQGTALDGLSVTLAT
jgi:hypothetical protein